MKVVDGKGFEFHVASMGYTSVRRRLMENVKVRFNGVSRRTESYVLGEIPSLKDRIAIVRQLWGLTQDILVKRRWSNTLGDEATSIEAREARNGTHGTKGEKTRVVCTSRECCTGVQASARPCSTAAAKSRAKPRLHGHAELGTAVQNLHVHAVLPIFPSFATACFLSARPC